jgi:hypothetical protein
LLLDGGDIGEQGSIARLDTHDLDGGNRQSVGIALLFQPEAQVGTVA